MTFSELEWTFRASRAIFAVAELLVYNGGDNDVWPIG